MKLSSRLKQIESMVEYNYSHIWDCCCDHGFLGTSLLTKRAAEIIHFVDIVPELVDTIESKLKQFHPESASHWKTHCLDVAQLPVKEYQGKQLIIIAGVGGDLMVRMIDAIYSNHKYKSLDLDFLLCPVNRQFALREKLIALDFSLQDEKLIEDKGRFYEILLLSSTPNRQAKVSNVGEKIWQAEDSTQVKISKAYLAKTLGYYQAIQQSESNNVAQIIKAYKSVII